MRAFQSHSGGNTVDPSLEDNVETPYNWTEYIYRAGSSLDLHSVIQSGWITGGKDKKDGRQTVCFTAVDRLSQLQRDEPHDVTKSRMLSYRTRWKCSRKQ